MQQPSRPKQEGAKITHSRQNERRHAHDDSGSLVNEQPQRHFEPLAGLLLARWGEITICHGSPSSLNAAHLEKRYCPQQQVSVTDTSVNEGKRHNIGGKEAIGEQQQQGRPQGERTSPQIHISTLRPPPISFRACQAEYSSEEQHSSKDTPEDRQSLTKQMVSISKHRMSPFSHLSLVAALVDVPPASAALNLTASHLPGPRDALYPFGFLRCGWCLLGERLTAHRFHDDEVLLMDRVAFDVELDLGVCLQNRRDLVPLF